MSKGRTVMRLKKRYSVNWTFFGNKLKVCVTEIISNFLFQNKAQSKVFLKFKYLPILFISFNFLHYL